jgi:hypothetical protein
MQQRLFAHFIETTYLTSFSSSSSSSTTKDVKQIIEALLFEILMATVH